MAVVQAPTAARASQDRRAYAGLRSFVVHAARAEPADARCVAPPGVLLSRAPVVLPYSSSRCRAARGRGAEAYRARGGPCARSLAGTLAAWLKRRQQRGVRAHRSRHCTSLPMRSYVRVYVYVGPVPQLPVDDSTRRRGRGSLVHQPDRGHASSLPQSNQARCLAACWYASALPHTFSHESCSLSLSRLFNANGLGSTIININWCSVRARRIGARGRD